MPPFPGDEAGPHRGGPSGGSAVSRKQGASGRDVRYSVPPDAPWNVPRPPKRKAGKEALRGDLKELLHRKYINFSKNNYTFL